MLPSNSVVLARFFPARGFRVQLSPQHHHFLGAGRVWLVCVPGSTPHSEEPPPVHFYELLLALPIRAESCATHDLFFLAHHARALPSG